MAQGESPGVSAPHPLFFPLPRPAGERGRGEAPRWGPTAHAVGQILPPLTGLQSRYRDTALLQRTASQPRLVHLFLGRDTSLILFAFRPLRAALTLVLAALLEDLLQV